MLETLFIDGIYQVLQLRRKIEVLTRMLKIKLTGEVCLYGKHLHFNNEC